MNWVQRFKERKKARLANPESSTSLAVTEITHKKVLSLTRQIIAEDREDRVVNAAGAIAGMDSLVSAVRGMTTIMENDGGRLITGGR